VVCVNRDIAGRSVKDSGDIVEPLIAQGSQARVTCGMAEKSWIAA